MTYERVDVAVIGAGQAGLSSAYALRRSGLGFVVFDHNPGPGGAWRHRWPSLTLSAAHRVHDLPGLPLGEADASRPASEVVSEYFGRYERTFDLPVHRPVDVTAVRDDEDGRLLVDTSEGVWSVRGLINATGTWERPFWPYYPGRETFRGRQLHTVDYRSASEFAGRRVVVVGGGASAVQLLMEIAEVASATAWVTRRPPVWVDGPFDEARGRDSVARVEERVRRGLPPGSVVGATGLMLTPEVRAARDRGVLERLPMFERVTPDGVVWADGGSFAADVILWATGFRASLDHLAPLRLRAPGGGIEIDGTRAVRDPRVHLVGYGPSASTIGANRAGRTAVRDLRALLGRARREETAAVS
ncbi:NAD(P)-binding domain-containing protein [Thermomonospora umbrina]|uniref:Cation diffusion facilitator CzcD-associated flavoprotein CzcO n=1 Tax=Thermomonospora umbrina TaxID=111806 RepID=A0A3D9SUH5_9ACTN|nr:NAD(P)-binding domain-containing protein [Thermomonospora umbrina]REE99257.1 cation diffusion facilitator CzcD-associated flavoprotein CzcO [Thermomonospora umbrina]